MAGPRMQAGSPRRRPGGGQVICRGRYRPTGSSPSLVLPGPGSGPPQHACPAGTPSLQPVTGAPHVPFRCLLGQFDSNRRGRTQSVMHGAVRGHREQGRPPAGRQVGGRLNGQADAAHPRRAVAGYVESGPHGQSVPAVAVACQVPNRVERYAGGQRHHEQLGRGRCGVPTACVRRLVHAEEARVSQCRARLNDPRHAGRRRARSALADRSQPRPGCLSVCALSPWPAQLQPQRAQTLLLARPGRARGR
jgi:hypothetical protein